MRDAIWTGLMVAALALSACGEAPCTEPFITTHPDVDGDGHGDPSSPEQTCGVPDGRAESATDCDDSRAEVYPNAAEVCDGIDNDCDEAIDEETPPVEWFHDRDGDGYGGGDPTPPTCLPPTGPYLTDGTDCDDDDAENHPNNVEVCDGFDNDCDFLIDDDDDSIAINSQTIFWPDNDGDGYGDPAVAVAFCEPRGNAVDNGDDCDDMDARINPGEEESCNGIDDDCNLLVDDGLNFQDWYFDGDGDGYGAGMAENSCEQPSGFVLDGTDCVDNDAAVNPGAIETCNGWDDNCDALIDEAEPGINCGPG